MGRAARDAERREPLQTELVRDRAYVRCCGSDGSSPIRGRLPVAGAVVGDDPQIPALLVAGLLLFVPLEAAFDHLGELRVGAWLGLAACLAIALGSIIMVFTGSAAPAGATTSLPPQPRAAAPTELDLPPTPGGAAPTELDLPPAESPPTGRPVETIAAGWYPDPSGESRLRYWDGSGWTEHTQ